jgi:hypothetical protein
MFSSVQAPGMLVASAVPLWLGPRQWGQSDAIAPPAMVTMAASDRTLDAPRRKLLYIMPEPFAIHARREGRATALN